MDCFAIYPQNNEQAFCIIIFKSKRRKPMKLANKLKKLVEMGDFFNSSQMLRFQKENEYRTFTGGIISFGIIVTILIGFSSMIMNTLNLSTINYTYNVVKNDVPTNTVVTTSSEQNFMFGIEVWRLNLSSNVRYFDVVSRFNVYDAGVPQDHNMTLVQCTKEHWTAMPEVVKNFDQLEVSGWLCPPIGFSFDLYGKYSSDTYQQLAFFVQPCKNETDPSRPCASQAEIDQLFVDFQDWFYFTFYYINTVINPDQTTYKTYYLQDEDFVIFGKHMGVESFLFFTDYTINTDYSIWPFGNVIEDKGFLAEERNRKNQYMATQNNAFVGFYIAKGSRSLVYQREVQKISAVFSFMGGLIGAIMAVMFIVNSYTSFSYEISVAFEVFHNKNTKSNKDDPDEQKDKYKNLTVNFLHFIKYQIFSMSKDFAKKLDWPIIAHMYECRKEILNQLDIKSIIKRIVFLQYSLTYLFADYQLEGMQLNKPTSPMEIKEIREKIEMVSHDDEDSEMQTEQDVDNSGNNGSKEKNQINLSQQIVSPKSATDGFLSRTQNVKEPDSNILFAKKNKILTKNSSLMVQSIKQLSFWADAAPALSIRKKKISERRNSNLLDLKESAQKGDMVSQKIWENLKRSDQKERTAKISANFMEKSRFSHFREGLQPISNIPVQWLDRSKQES